MSEIVRKEYGRGKPISKELADEAARLYENGMTVPPIGKKLNIGRSAVYNILDNRGIKRRSHGYSRKKTIGIESDIASSYKEGLSALEVGEKFGIHESTVFVILREMRVASRPTGKHDASKSPNWKGGISKTIEYKREKCARFTKLYRETKPLFKLTLTLRGRISGEFRRAKLGDNIKGTQSTIDLLGADFTVVMQHIESQFQEGMTWDSHGRKGWHVDHIVPLASAKTKEELFKLFRFENLQPLWAEDNHKKHAKLNWKKQEELSCP